jgi:hypothetical protein
LTTADGCVEARLTAVVVFIFDNNVQLEDGAHVMLRPSWMADLAEIAASGRIVELEHEFRRVDKQPAMQRFGREMVV